MDNTLAGILDTGFSGYGVVGKCWLAGYQKFMTEKYGYGQFERCKDSDDQRHPKQGFFELPYFLFKTSHYL